MATSKVHISSHPCLQAKIAQFRSKSTDSRDTNRLVHEITLLLGTEALSGVLTTTESGTDESPLGYQYPRLAIDQRLSLVPVLRSGLGMISAVQMLLPDPCPVHHLGLFREPVTLQPVEYYNNLPNHEPRRDKEEEAKAGAKAKAGAGHVAIIVDPIIATGGTAVAAIQTLREWGVDRVVFLCVIGSRTGVQLAAQEWPEGAEIWVGAVDETLDGKAYLNPGCGDVGDRLFLTKGR